MTDEELFAAWSSQAQYEGICGTNRKLKAAAVVDALTRLLEYQRRDKARGKSMSALTEREALQRLICSDSESGCIEIVALREQGWTVESAICDESVTITAYRGKE